MALFESRTDLPTSAEKLFDFLIKPANLQAIAPPEMQFVYVNPPAEIKLDDRLTCKAQAYGMVQQLTYVIDHFEAPNTFREKMVEGPFKLWLHDLIIEQQSPELTTLINRIEFEPPGGLIGFLVTEEKILDALEDGFDYRRSELERLFAKS